MKVFIVMEYHYELNETIIKSVHKTYEGACNSMEEIVKKRIGDGKKYEIAKETEVSMLVKWKPLDEYDLDEDREYALYFIEAKELLK